MLSAEAVVPVGMVLDEDAVDPFVEVFVDMAAVLDDDLLLDEVVPGPFHQLVFLHAPAVGGVALSGGVTGLGLGEGDHSDHENSGEDGFWFHGFCGDGRAVQCRSCSPIFLSLRNGRVQTEETLRGLAVPVPPEARGGGYGRP